MTTQCVPVSHDAPRGWSGSRPVTKRAMLRCGAALGGVAVLAGCAVPGGSAPDSAASKQPVTLHWGLYNEPGVLNAAKKALPVFNEKFPYITIVQEPNSNSGGDYGPLLAADSAPDVMAACCANLPIWGGQGLLRNLDPMLKRDGKEIPLADFMPTLMQYWNLPQRGQFALPMSPYTRGLYYNRTSFKRKGLAFPDENWDWNMLRDAMVKLNEPEQQRWGYYIVVDYERTGHYIRANGGHHVDPKDNTKAVFDSTQALTAMQWLHDRMWKDNALAKKSDLASMGIGALKMLAQGNLAMLTEGMWNVPALLAAAPDLADQWDLAPMPKGPAGRDTHCSTDGWTTPVASKLPDQAWAMLKFLQSDTWAEPAIALAGFAPTRKSWLDRYAPLMKQAYPALADKNMASLVDGSKKDYSRPLELFKKHPDSAKVFNDTVDAVYVRNEKPLEDAFRAAAKQVTGINTAS